jgi:lysylphosphatidylglycerol synthetase-like protein (DUF2156 family)
VARTSSRSRPAGASRRPVPAARRPVLVPFAAVFGLLVAAEDGYLTFLLSVVWAMVVPLLLALLAVAGAVLVWLGRGRGWLVLTVAAVLPLVGLLGLAVVFGLVGGGAAFLTALVLPAGPIGALVLSTRPEVRAWTTRGRPAAGDGRGRGRGR